MDGKLIIKMSTVTGFITSDVWMVHLKPVGFEDIVQSVQSNIFTRRPFST